MDAAIFVKWPVWRKAKNSPIFEERGLCTADEEKKGHIPLPCVCSIGKKEYGPMNQSSSKRSDRLVASDTRRQQLHDLVDRIADFSESFDGSFLAFETKLKKHVWVLARLLIGLFLLARHHRIHEKHNDYAGYRKMPGLFR